MEELLDDLLFALNNARSTLLICKLNKIMLDTQNDFVNDLNGTNQVVHPNGPEICNLAGLASQQKALLKKLEKDILHCKNMQDKVLKSDLIKEAHLNDIIQDLP